MKSNPGPHRTRVLDPRINAGASLGDTTIDEFSFITGLMCKEKNYYQ
jgi:hypothetical protein